jgi:hypothetical protein
LVRTGLAFGGIVCAVAFAWRGEWLSAGLASAGVVLAVAFWAYGEMADARAMMRGLMRDALRDAVPVAGKHRMRHEPSIPPPKPLTSSSGCHTLEV